MTIQHETHLLDPNSILVIRGERQRREITSDDLQDSIKKRGQMQPIVVNRVNNKLVAGERRLHACKVLQIPVKVWYADELSDLELKILELDENTKRQDLTWQEKARAIADIHELYSQLEPDWSQVKTAEMLGYAHSSAISDMLSAAEELNAGNERVLQAKTKNQAINIINRKQDRQLAAVMDELLNPEEPEERKTVLEQSIFQADFHQWAKEYKGPRFNFIHCDFPYGINLQDSEQGNISQFDTYSDTQDHFWRLCDTLSKEQDRLFSASCHFMFWFDMAQYTAVFRYLNDKLDLEIFPIPFIWHKTDNKGILSDPQRRARHIYEACFYGHRGDRKIVQAISDVYGCPTFKEGDHMSVKPEPMLRNFFRMFIDDTTTFFDPTCGSGASLRAAESCGAKTVLGLEINPDFARSAQRELTNFRTKRKLEGITKEKSNG